MGEHFVMWAYRVGVVVCVAGGMAIAAGTVLLALHAVWRMFAHLYGMGWVLDAMRKHAKTNPLPRWTGFNHEDNDDV